MALVKCKECGEEISDSAEACPKCGKPTAKKKKSYGCGTILLILIAAVVLISIISPDEKKATNSNVQSTAPKKELTREEKIERNFSSWDGSHRALTKLIKESMNDPKSYEHVETLYWDKGDYLQIKTTFRGKNAFGGTVANWITVKADLNGNLIEVIAQGSP